MLAWRLPATLERFRRSHTIGLGMWSLACLFGATAFGATTNYVYFQMAPMPNSGYLTNGLLDGSPTNWIPNASNAIVDPFGFGNYLSVKAEPFSSAAIFSHWSGTLAADLIDTNNPVITDLLVGGQTTSVVGTLVANFAAKVNLLVSSANTSQGQTIPVSGTTTSIPLGRAVAIQAVPLGNYEFASWQVLAGNITVEDTNANPAIVTANAVNPQPHLRAFFKLKKRLTIGIIGTGDVYLSSPTVQPPVKTNIYYFNQGETVTLSAIPAAGNEFKGWTGNVSDPEDPDTTIVMNSDQTVTVQFGPPVIKRTLIVLAGPNGSVTPFGTNFVDDGKTVEIAASPNPGFAFYRWTGTNGVSPVGKPLDNPASYVMDMDRNFMAHFTNVYQVTVHERIPASTVPDVFDVVAGMPWTQSQSNRWFQGDPTQRERYYLLGWTQGTGDVVPAAGPGMEVSVLSAKQVSSFRWNWQLQYLLSDNVAPSNTGSVSIDPPTRWIPAGSNVTLTAVPETGYTFMEWRINGAVHPDKNTTITIVMDGPKNVLARFEQVTEEDKLYREWALSKGLDPDNPNSFEDSKDGDPDNDGFTNYQEFLLSLDLNAASNRLMTRTFDPLSADTDGDGMDDYWEHFYLTPETEPGQFVVSAALLREQQQGIFGEYGNPDGDFKWDTSTGYMLSNQPLYNIDEWMGPDGEPPCTYQLVPWQTAFPSGVDTGKRRPVLRRVPNPNDTGDSSHPWKTDTEEDGFDDGYEFSWDQWQQANQGNSILADPSRWPGITNVVPAWPSERRYNPAVPLAVTPNTLVPDFDRLYDPVTGSSGGAFSDFHEYEASILSLAGGPNSNWYPVIRHVQRPERWCTNPFMWDTDGDGIPDGWELVFGYDPWWADRHDRLNPDGDAYAYIDNATIHSNVYLAIGFNPHTAWRADNRAQFSRPFVNLMEFAGPEGLLATGGVESIGVGIRTNPYNVDTDGDGMWDGWEYYLGFDPTSPLGSEEDVDGTEFPTGDGLANYQEFLSVEVLMYWRYLVDAGRTPDAIQPGWLAFVESWPNKTLPTNPYDHDTDGDQIWDGEEQNYFNYQTGYTLPAGSAAPNAPLVPGGGLNPCTVDTDLDYLPDFWEAYWTGSMGTDTNGAPLWGGGMDGTVSDAFLDYDGDGLYNYQEYLIGACYQWQWAFNNGMGTLGDPFGTDYDPYDFFDIGLSGGDSFTGPGALAARAEWDPAYWADRMNLPPYKQFTFLSAPHYPVGFRHFSTGNPGNADTDGDGYDDFFEIYHSMNPIRGPQDRVAGKLFGLPEAVDFSYMFPIDYDQPYRWGESPLAVAADYDQDGLVDVEENLTPNLPAVQSYYHTDPSPYFVADLSTNSSYINRFYKTGWVFGAQMYWYWDPDVLADLKYPAAYLFTFEINEGYDTDNDMMPDSVEVSGMLHSQTNALGATDPLDDDSPLRQRALYLDGVDSAARLFMPGSHSWFSFRSFTVEAWVRPVSVSGDRVIVERAGLITSGNPGLPPGVKLARNFRLGLTNGVPYIGFDGFGATWNYNIVLSSPQFRLETNQWYHLAGVFDSASKRLSLFVNGELVAGKSTMQIPFNGFLAGDPTGDTPLIAESMMVTVGASDWNPLGVCDGTRDRILSGFPAWGMPLTLSYPNLRDFFHGWVDEVRIWDGTRTLDQIRALRNQKTTRRLVNEINGVITGNQSFMGDLGGREDNPKLLYAYNFDSLQNPDDRIVPAGFESTLYPSVGPFAWDKVLWWAEFPLASRIYNDRRFVKWIQNLASRTPFNPPRDTRMILWINPDGTTNNFPNSSNPYNFEYVHGQGGQFEHHPQYGFTDIILFTGMGQPNAARPFSGIYGDLLPLGGARGDDTILMWDGSRPADGTRDQDEDGMPDEWEERYGLDPHDPSDAHQDVDEDGLSNYLEYLVGSDPLSGYSLSANVSDFFAYINGVAGPYRFVGEEKTDMDYMEDFWESVYFLNTEMYDATGEKADPDGDGWSNLAEFQSLARLRLPGQTIDTNSLPVYAPLANNAYYNGLLSTLDYLGTDYLANAIEWNNPQDDRFYPRPEILFRFQYAGQYRDRANPTFAVLAYTDRKMDIPDAVISGSGDRSGSYPRFMRVNSLNANGLVLQGYIREGNNWFWGFMDLNGDGVYQANEPAGFAGPINVGWGAVGPVDIPLTDRAPAGFTRFSWTPDSDAERYRIYIVDRNRANAPTVFYQVYTPFRTFLHEGDLMRMKETRRGLPRAGGYSWFVRSVNNNQLTDVADGGAFVSYNSPPSQPKLLWPLNGARLRQSRDVFEWKMDPTVTWCVLRVVRVSDGEVVLNYGFVPPFANAFGRVSMAMPIYIGDGVFQNGTYEYTLTTRNPAGVSSAKSRFEVRVGNYAGYSYSFSGRFIYPGKVTNGVFVAEAFTSPGFGGEPVGRTLIPNTSVASAWPTNLYAFTIRGLPAGRYYIRVYLDQNTATYPNYKADAWESQGWLSSRFYFPRAVNINGATTDDEWIKVLMRDTDQDKLPDDWEYMYTGSLDVFGFGTLRGYTPALTGPLNVFECYGFSPFGANPL